MRAKVVCSDIWTMSLSTITWKKKKKVLFSDLFYIFPSRKLHQISFWHLKPQISCISPYQSVFIHNKATTIILSSLWMLLLFNEEQLLHFKTTIILQHRDKDFKKKKNTIDCHKYNKRKLQWSSKSCRKLIKQTTGGCRCFLI